MHLPVPKTTDMYRYAEKPSTHWNFKLGYAISILAWLLSVAGILLFAGRSPGTGLFFVPLALLLSAFYTVSIRTNMAYRRFDSAAHERRVRDYDRAPVYPSVDVFLPICGESLDVLKNTWLGVAALEYPAERLAVYVLDDGASEGAEALADAFGFRYLRRPNPRVMKKAGNLKFAFEQSRGAFIIILDADFRPHPRFLRHTLPTMLDDPSVAIVQTPQYFDYDDDTHARSPLEYGAGNIQEYFYKIVQPSRDVFGAAICVGSCALYRRSALEQVGGTYQIEHSEDVWTGFSLLRVGYKVTYLPLILSKGVCPDDANAHYKQQARWATGSLSLATSRFFWQAPVPWRTRFPFFSGFLFYLSTIPFLVLHFAGHLLLWTRPGDLGPASTALMVVSWTNAYFLLRYHIYPNARLGTVLAFMAAVWAYAYTVINRFVLRRIEAWVPTGSLKGLSPGFRGVVRWAQWYQGITLTCCIASVVAMDRTNPHQYPIVATSLVFAVLTGVYIKSMRAYQRRVRKELGNAFASVGESFVAGVAIGVAHTGVGSIESARPDAAADDFAATGQ